MDKVRSNRIVPGRKINELIRSRRAPLVRAMSAPSRPASATNRTTVNSHNNRRGQVQQPPRNRRRILPAKEDLSNLRQTFTSVQIRDFDEDNNNEEEERFCHREKIRDERQPPRKSSAKSSKSSKNPSATTFSCDQIVTLVSLLDSGGSDSEREGDGDVNKSKHAEQVSSSKGNSISSEKAPNLRKAGKSGKWPVGLSCFMCM